MPLRMEEQMTPAKYIAKYGMEIYLHEAKKSAERNMAEVDAMPEEWRRLVHEYGLPRIRRLRHLSFRKAQIELLATTLDL